MSRFSRFLDKRLGVRFDRNTLGNLVKNVAPAVAFTPAGVLGAGAMGALGESLRSGSNLGDIAKAGLSNAAIGGGAKAGYGALRSLASGGSGGAAASASAPDMGGYRPFGIRDGARMANVAPAAETASAGRGGFSLASAAKGAGRVARSAGSFMKENPEASAMGLRGLGQLATAGAANRREDAELRLLEARAQEIEDAEERRKRQEEQIAAILGPYFQGVMQRGPGRVAANPYG